MSRLSTAEATVETLLRHGLDTVYALPGLHQDPLFDAFYHASDRLRVIHPRHEQTAAYMALGAALATGKPQAFAVVPGPGLLNAGAALLTAYGMNAPVIGLIGQIPQADIDRGHGHLHEIHDQLGLMRHITKWAERIRGPQEAPTLVSQAIWHATSGRPRPVALECALDTWAKRSEVVIPDAPLPLPPETIDDEAVETAAKILGNAERPIIVLGGGSKASSADDERSWNPSCGADRAFELRTTVGEFARGHYGDHAGKAAAYLFEVDRASMTDEEIAASIERETEAWVALGTIGGANFGWIHERDYDPARVPVPVGYATVLAQYS